ncbi:hypothetical protein [Haliangium ochraceum]|uniref:Uncharacterized protein n=1 Tax=Haliangium ochraceum (strain DSM 14365 / JCM 11303 / SMP-2) TaxID=502025 RepID=D0LW61_HALO1|nr:hypothetical protein [Haliangium ochraceum]ACY15993.1 hypothetical protein Hoch_3491 [Haliangium ochraceum DSM 14365]
MARANVDLIRALRQTAERLRGDVHYQWGHMGECNCGHLAQTITRLDKRLIHAWALEREGDWAQQVHDYCPSSGYRIDDIITAMLDLGMARDDIEQLEKLADPAVLALVRARTGDERRHLRRNLRDDVILYMDTWADLLAADLPAAPQVAA